MFTVPPSVLLAQAALLSTWAGRAVVRAGFRTAVASGIPLVGVERMASALPTAEVARGVSPIVLELAAANARPGPLAGGTVVVKDHIDVAGAPTGFGLTGPKDLATKDAVLIRGIREAGGVVIAKTKMTELGMDGIGSLMPDDMPANALAEGYAPGGSSTGTSVAVALGLARFGVGSDGLGSVRIPAAFAGLVGLKPGRGAVSHEGYNGVAQSMEEPGPITRTVADAALLFAAMAGVTLPPLTAKAPLVVGLVHGLGPDVASSDQRRAFTRVLDALSIPRRALVLPGARGLHPLAVAVSTEELSRTAQGARSESGQGRLNVALGRAMAGERPWLERTRALLCTRCDALFEDVEVLAMPTTALPPPALTPGLMAGGEDVSLLRALGAYTPLANLTYLPAISVPSGRDARGRPLSIMFMGRKGSEARLLEIALAVEATGLGDAPVT